MMITIDTIKQAEELQEELASRKSINMQAILSRIQACSDDYKYRDLDKKMLWLRMEEELLRDVDIIMDDLITSMKQVCSLQTKLEIIDRARENPLLKEAV